MTAPHGPVDALLAELHASRGGLTPDEARRRLGEVGPNEPARAPRTAGLVQILLLLANPLVIILLIASAASALLGERVNASIIVLMVALSVVLNFVQTYRSHRVAERLRDTVAPTATVLRDGAWSEIRRRDLVPGDVVRLAAGDRVPADARLLEARDLHVQQAALTGESMPVEKDAGDLEVAPRQPADAPQRRLPRHVGRQRHGDGAGRRRRGRRPRSATSPRAWRRVRPRPSSSAALRRFSAADPAHGRSSWCSSSCWSASLLHDASRVAALRGGAGGRA